MLKFTPSPAENEAFAALFNAGRHAELEQKARSLVEQYPGAGYAWKLLGTSLQVQGKPALPALQRASELLPDDAVAHFNLGVAQTHHGKFAAAVGSFRRALEIQPDIAEAHSNLGNIYRTLGEFDQAIASHRQALEIKPDYAEAHSNLGNALKDSGQLENAVASYRRALKIKPDFPLAHNNLGVALQDLGRFDDAIVSYGRALALKPDYDDAHNNLGTALKKQGQLDQAEASCRRAIALEPDNADAYGNLGEILKDAGNLDEAIAALKRAVALDPAKIENHSNLVYATCFHPAFDEGEILAEAKQFVHVHKPSSFFKSRERAVDQLSPARRLRIGYVSPDFRNHCQSLFTIPLLSRHDHTSFEIYCYADLLQADAISERLKSHADVWRTTHAKSDAYLAELIANDGIDILVDLTMHMDNGRPMVFRQKPAPVQLAWLAYPGTTGLPEIDYRLTDPWLDPPEFGDDRYTETSIRLPDSFWCYDPLISGLQVNSLPALASGQITFGCLNNFCKVSDDTLRRWAQVMVRVPSSRLVLLAAAGRHRHRVIDLLASQGIGAERIEFVEYRPRMQYLQTYHRIDICLDTLPYNGHTTSIDAYWMGVPVVTQVGKTVVGRAGWSQLNNLGLPELAAFNEQSFVDIAVALAADVPRLSKLRQELRGKLEHSPLMDAKRFTAAIETIYRQIWEKYCNNCLAPAK